jgi:hypothetical protein
VQRIRIRLNAFSIDSVPVNAPSYPAIAVEANPANAVENGLFWWDVWSAGSGIDHFAGMFHLPSGSR